jgi:hypothetical protein
MQELLLAKLYLYYTSAVVPNSSIPAKIKYRHVIVLKQFHLFKEKKNKGKEDEQVNRSKPSSFGS